MMAQKKIQVVLVDDEVRALNRMKILLSNFSQIEILELFDDTQDAIDYIIKHKPNMVFLDIEMPGKTGLEIADEINKNTFDTKIIYVSSHEHYAIKAIKTQAFDYLLKPVNIDELKKSIERYVSKEQTGLTTREIEIIRLIAKGFNSKQIGEQLFISRHTVDTYRRKILEKTQCGNAAGLIQYAAKHEIV